MDLSFLTSPADAHTADPWTARGEAKVCGFRVKSSRFESGICWLAVTSAHGFTPPCLRFVTCASTWSCFEKVQQAKEA